MKVHAIHAAVGAALAGSAAHLPTAVAQEGGLDLGEADQGVHRSKPREFAAPFQFSFAGSGR
jgi:hypothetical protein